MQRFVVVLQVLFMYVPNHNRFISEVEGLIFKV